jgi:hypothetical protein
VLNSEITDGEAMLKNNNIPFIRMVLANEDGRAIALGFQMETIPGIPDPETPLIAGLRLAVESTTFKKIPKNEVDANLAAIAETLMGARYHKLRFDKCLEVAIKRRAVIGGPVVADWHAVPPILFEAKAYLGAVRTIVDTSKSQRSSMT